jgi:Yip1 domain
MNAVARARAILFNPAATWPGIEKDVGDPAFLLSRYVAVLALIPALSGFVGATLIGAIAPSGAIVRADLIDGALGAVFNYAASCAIVLLLGLTVNLLAPLFGGRRDFEDAFKLVVFSFTPLWLAGLFLLLPGLRFLLLTGAYGIYLFWLGAPRLTKLPEQQALNFTVLIVICACGLLFAAALMQRALFGTPGL